MTFTFHLQNTGALDYGLIQGCSGTTPLALTTPRGLLGVGSGDADSCGISCEARNGGDEQQGCSDCGISHATTLAAGMTVDLTWDRRVYFESHSNPACTSFSLSLPCAEALLVSPSATQMGTLRVCTTQEHGSFDNCDPMLEIPFTVDTTAHEGTVVVN